MRSMQWQLGILGNISAFAYRHRETKKNLCRSGRSHELLNTDFQPAVQNLKQKQHYTHSTTNTHKLTTIHTRQLHQYTRDIQQKYTQDNYNNTHKITTTIHTRQLQQYTQDNYNNTHKTTTSIHTRHLATIHTRQLQQYTQDNQQQYTHLWSLGLDRNVRLSRPKKHIMFQF